MINENPVSTAPGARRPIHSILMSFPIACFCGALVTDIAYASTADMMWADFSAWLLAAGMVISVPAAIAGAVDVVTNRGLRPQRRTLALVTGGLMVLALAAFNNLIHSRDAWTSVVPTGLVLSAGTVVAIIVTTWFGFATPVRQRAAVQYFGIRK